MIWAAYYSQSTKVRVFYCKCNLQFRHSSHTNKGEPKYISESCSNIQKNTNLTRENQRENSEVPQVRDLHYILFYMRPTRSYSYASHVMIQWHQSMRRLGEPNTDAKVVK